MSRSLDEGKARLKKAVESGRLSHAILISADSTVACELVLYAASLVFDKAVDKVTELPDFLQIDAKGFKVEDSDALLSTLGITPASGKRVIAFSNAGKMSAICQNTLLKTIEEPPKDNHFFLYGSEKGLLPTIHSRCAHITLGELSYGDIAEYVEKRGASHDDALYYAHISGGSAEIAIRLFEDGEYLKFTETCAEYFCRLKAACMVSDALKDFAQYDALRCADVFELCLSDMRRLKIGLFAQSFTREPLSENVKRCSQRLTEKEISDIAPLLCDVKIALNTNVPARQVLENFAAKTEQVVNYGKI